MSIQDETRAQVRRFLDESKTLWEDWNLQALTQQDWSELYVEKSRWHQAADEAERFLSVFLEEPEKEHETILHLLRARQELLLCLQEVYFTDLLRESELQVCGSLEDAYRIAAEQTAWDQKLARRKNLLRMAVLEHQLGEDKLCRRRMRTAKEQSVAGSGFRNVREFASCYDCQAEFECHLPVEGFQYPVRELERLDEALSAFCLPLQSLMMDYVLYNEQEKLMLQDLFTQLLFMTSQCFTLHTKARQKKEAIGILRESVQTADRAPAQLQEAVKGNLWYLEASYAWLLTQDEETDEPSQEDLASYDPSAEDENTPVPAGNGQRGTLGLRVGSGSAGPDQRLSVLLLLCDLHDEISGCRQRVAEIPRTSLHRELYSGQGDH